MALVKTWWEPLARRDMQDQPVRDSNRLLFWDLSADGQAALMSCNTRMARVARWLWQKRHG